MCQMPSTVINVSHVILTAAHARSSPIDVPLAQKDSDYSVSDAQACSQWAISTS